ncbi:MAG: glycosyltransferase family 4 protein [Salibacteraceae bacterium]
MKVLHISSPKTWRGGEQQLIYLVEELQTLGVDQVVMCPFNSAVHKYCLKNHRPHVTYFKGFSANPMVAFKVSHVCRKEQIDLIHVHDSHAHNFAVLSAVLTNLDLPIIVSRRVDFRVHGGGLSLFKYNHPNVKKVVCVSHAIKEIMTEFIEKPDKLAVVHSGIDLSKFDSIKTDARLRKELGVSKDCKLIGNVAALAPHKDYFTFIETAKKLIDNGLNAHFLAIGEGPSRKEIEQRISSEGMDNYITLTGFRTDVLNLLVELDVFLITSETEGLGTSILDALALGVPVVATRAGGIVEVVENGFNGLTCEVKNSDELSTAVLKLLKNDPLKESLILNGKEKIKQFDKRLTAEKTLAIYDEVLSELD